jgi:hypothetical protein
VGATWRAGRDRDSAVFIRRIPGRFARAHVTIRVAPDGRLRGLQLTRWGNPEGKGFGEHLFDVTFDSERTAYGSTVPDGFHAAWVDRDGVRTEFFRARIDTFTIGQGGGDDGPA